jgi:ABC-type glutathione transport system ATPase component
MIRRLHAENSMTVIMVSHSMDDIATLATRLLVMSRAELVMSGTPREIFSRREDLMAIGLGVPKGAELCHRLRQAATTCRRASTPSPRYATRSSRCTGGAETVRRRKPPRPPKRLANLPPRPTGHARRRKGANADA